MSYMRCTQKFLDISFLKSRDWILSILYNVCGKKSQLITYMCNTTCCSFWSWAREQRWSAMKPMVMFEWKVISEQLAKIIKGEFDLETNHEWYNARMEMACNHFCMMLNLVEKKINHSIVVRCFQSIGKIKKERKMYSLWIVRIDLVLSHHLTSYQIWRKPFCSK